MHYLPLTPKVVLGIAAHPDDLDANAGGTMAAYARSGADVYYLILTDGGNGSEDPGMTAQKLMYIRRQEQRDAGDITGLKDVFFCDYRDGSLENTVDVRRDIVKIIRTVKPDVVITWDPSGLYCANKGFINHPDHRAAGQAALDAVYPLARDHMAFPDLFEQGYAPHKTATVLLMNLDNHNFCVDITATLETKLQALATHTSQVSDVAAMRSLWTGLAAEAGQSSGITYAEAFMRIDISAL